MRELEFLPEWYRRLQARRRMLSLQIWLTLAVIAGLGLWLVVAGGNRRERRYALDELSRQLAQTDAQLQQMERLEAASRQCRQKADALAKLGTYLDASRVVARLGEIIPDTVSLTNLTFETEETAAVLSGAQRASLKDLSSVPTERRLRARLVGVAPTDVEMATFLTELNKVPFLDNVTATFARDRRESGHVLREFELVFFINLNALAGS